jgi:hypothetical protein
MSHGVIRTAKAQPFGYDDLGGNGVVCYGDAKTLVAFEKKK